MRAVTSMLTVSLLVPLAALSAQEPPPIEAGSRIRVTAPAAGADKLVGTWLDSDGVELRVQTEEQPSPLTISLADVTRLEVSNGRKSKWLIGAGIGAVGGAVLGAALGANMQGDFSDSDKRIIAATGLGLAGALVGGLVGSQIKTERWEEVPLDRLRVSIVPLRDGRFALGLSVEF